MPRRSAPSPALASVRCAPLPCALAPCALENLEARSLMSAPQVADLRFDTPAPQLWESTTISVRAEDDTGVRAVTFFLDRNRNGAWDPATDQALGEAFTPGQDGRFRVTVTPDHTWPRDGFEAAALVADAVDIDGNWAAQRATRNATLESLPFIQSFSVVLQYNPQQPNVQVVHLYASAADDFSRNLGLVGVTFFADRDENGRWTPGVDTDLGITSDIDSRGYYWKVVGMSGDVPRRFGAVAVDANTALANRFGPVRTATPWSEGEPSFDVPLVVGQPTWQNLSRPGETPTFGDNVRLTFVADAPRDVAAVTLFYDRDFSGSWTPGVDRDLGTAFFQPDVLRGRARIEFTVTPDMEFSFRPFVLTVKDRSGAANEWGNTFTTWVPIASPPWIEGARPNQTSFGAATAITADFTTRDDAGVRTVLAWLDRDGNGRQDAGEAFQPSAVRLTTSGATSTWRTALDLTGLNYTPGTYRLFLIATDFQNLASRPVSVNVTLV